MNTKFCYNCGKELPMEASFCPYCMTKLIDVRTGEPIKVKKRKYAVLIVAIAAVLVLALAGTAVFFIVSSIKNNASTSITNTSSASSAAASVSSGTDYSKYIGLWSDKDNDIDNITSGSGNLLEIISVNDDIIRFTFTKSSSRIARISNITCKIIDGVGSFTFDDDSWQNSGTGKIKLMGNEIYLETNITNANDKAMWNIGGKFYLEKSQGSVIDFESYNYLNEDFDNVRNIFGEERAGAYSASDKWNIHTYSGFTVTVLKETNRIVSIAVNYYGTLSKSELCYGSLNGNSTYDDVYAKLGEPTYNSLSYGTVAYNINGGTGSIEFKFDDNMTITEFLITADNTH
ncbi:MAG: hypothetical protein ACI4F2_01745 [Acutalibacteraceae bacterium]